MGQDGKAVSFEGDTDAKYHVKIKSFGDVDEFTFAINGQKFHFHEGEECRGFEQGLKLKAKNTFVIDDLDGKSGSSVTITISTTDIDLPPAPSSVAPAPAPNASADIASDTAFIYSGANPIQTGVAAGAILPTQVSLVHGKILDSAQNGLSGVQVQVLGSPQLGQTLTQADGSFDLAVNGGGIVTLVFSKTGYLSSQRQVKLSLRSFANLSNNVVMIPADTKVSLVNLSKQSSAQVISSSPSTDASGTRTTSLYFPSGTSANLVFPDGVTQGITTLSVRATEFTVGPNGPNQMPADLPTNTKYTYAVGLNADEATAAGAYRVTFSQPVYHYTDNFLNFPVGTTIPVGFYDELKGMWVPSANGKVLRVLSIKAGVPSLDITGAGTTATAADLASLNITASELASIGTLFKAGKSFWRSPIAHFTNYDLNFFAVDPYTQNQLASGSSADQNQNPVCAVCQGSKIQVESQILGEQIPIAGTDFQLVYTGARIMNRTSAYTLNIPITTANFPSITQAFLNINIAGELQSFSFPPTANQTFQFKWDGKDGFGRTMHTPQTASIQLSYQAPANYLAPLPVPNVFNTPLFTTFATPNPARTLTDSHILYSSTIGTSDARIQSMGGWTLNVHHSFDPNSQTLFLGNGTQFRAGDTGYQQASMAGYGVAADFGDGGPAVYAGVNTPEHAVGLADGSTYIADGNLIRYVSPTGIISTFAGTGTDYLGNNIPLANAAFSYIFRLAISKAGTLFVADYGQNLIRSITPDGVVHVVLGRGGVAPSSTPTLGNLLTINQIRAMAVADDGTLFVATRTLDGIIRVGTDGRAAILPGSASVLPASLYTGGFACSGDGKLIYLTINSGLTVFKQDGSISVISMAGLRSGEFPLPVALDANDQVFFVTNQGNLYKVNGGQIAQIYLSANLDTPHGMFINADNSILIGETQSHKVVKINKTYQGFTNAPITIASSDGAQLFDFDPSGRHLKTRDRFTNAVIYAFNYDSNFNLVSVTDRSGNVTSIQRASGGQPTGIVSPYGVTTKLAVNSDGYMSSVTDPLGGSYQISYASGTGLITQFTKPNLATSKMAYDSFNRLISDQDASGATQALARQDTSSSNYNITYTSAAGAATNYSLYFGEEGSHTFTRRYADGTASTSYGFWGGGELTNNPDGSSVETISAGDPIYGFQSNFAGQQFTFLPSGITVNQSQTKSISFVSQTTSSPFTITQSQNYNGLVSTQTFDSSTLTWTALSPAGRTSKYSLDVLGRISSYQSPGLTPVALSYDSQGRLAGTLQGARQNSLTYDGRGYLASITNALSQTTTYQRDALGRVIMQSLPDGRQIQFSFDASNNITSVTPPGRPAYQFSFSLTDDLITAATPLKTTSAYTYAKDHQLQSITRPDGQVIQFNYSPVTSKLTSISTPQGNYIYSYNSSGQIASIRSPQGVLTSYSYNGPLVTGVVNSGAATGNVAFGFNNNLDVSSVSVNGDSGATMMYDADRLLRKAGPITLTRDSATGLINGYSFAGNPDVQTIARNSFGEQIGASDLAGNVNVTNFDSLGRIVSQSGTLLGGAYSNTIKYDNAGRLISFQSNGGSPNTYSYDSNSNRIAAKINGVNYVGTYDNDDHILSFGGTTYTHNQNGERISATDTSGKTAYSFDSFGNLIGVTLPNGTQIAYLLDGLNRRAAKLKNGVIQQQFVYDNQNRIVGVLDGNGNLLQHFVYAFVQNSPSGMYMGGNFFQIYVNTNGTVLITGLNSVTYQYIAHDEFGRVLYDSTPGFQPFGFDGGLVDQDTHLVHFGAREYDPYTGRWLTKDPLGFGGGSTNLYSYSVNDPVNFIDPSGLSTIVRLYSDNAGHVSVQVGNDSALGFYPSGNLLNSSGRLQSDNFRNDIVAEIVLNTTPEQEMALSSYYRQNGFSQQYGLFDNNCAIFAGKALKAAGIVAPTSDILPKSFFTDLGKMNGL